VSSMVMACSWSRRWRGADATASLE